MYFVILEEVRCIFWGWNRWGLGFLRASVKYEAWSPRRVTLRMGRVIRRVTLRNHKGVPKLFGTESPTVSGGLKLKWVPDWAYLGSERGLLGSQERLELGGD